MADLTIVIPVRDDVRIGRCLASIDDRHVKPLVVMNDPSDEVQSIVHNVGCDSLTLPTANGPAACETGIQAADTDFVLMMDSDCVFNRGTLAQFRDAMGSADFVRGITLFRHHTTLQRVIAKSRTRHTNMPRMVFKVPLLFDRRVIDRIGGYVFDQRLSWTEDFDLTMRVHLAGASVRQLHNAIVIHDSLTVRRDLTSAFRYGQGHRSGVHLGLPGYKDVTWRQGLQLPLQAVRQEGLSQALYDYLFNLTFTTGYKMAERRRGE